MLHTGSVHVTWHKISFWVQQSELFVQVKSSQISFDMMHYVKNCTFRVPLSSDTYVYKFAFAYPVSKLAGYNSYESNDTNSNYSPVQKLLVLFHIAEYKSNESNDTNSN